MKASSEHLIALMSIELGISEDEAKERMGVIVDALAKGLGQGRGMEVRDFGVITPVFEFDTPIRNPKTGEKLIQERGVRLTFTCSKSLTIIHPEA